MTLFIKNVLFPKLVLATKRALYSSRGEPYKIAGHTLRYLPGTRPVRLKYANQSTDWVSMYDALEIKMLLAGIKEGDTLIDVGAHVGQYSVLMAALGGARSTVIAFEPDYHARVKLMKNIGLNPQIKSPIVESLALSDAPGRATFYSKGGNSNSSLAAGATGGSPKIQNESFQVELITLDGYLESRQLSPKWIKIDTEGAEIRILKGASEILNADCNFLVELHPYAWPEFGNAFSELQAVVAAAGREMRYIDRNQELTDEPVYGVVVLETKRKRFS